MSCVASVLYLSYSLCTHRHDGTFWVPFAFSFPGGFCFHPRCAGQCVCFAQAELHLMFVTWESAHQMVDLLLSQPCFDNPSYLVPNSSRERQFAPVIFYMKRSISNFLWVLIFLSAASFLTQWSCDAAHSYRWQLTATSAFSVMHHPKFTVDEISRTLFLLKSTCQRLRAEIFQGFFGLWTWIPTFLFLLCDLGKCMTSL